MISARLVLGEPKLVCKMLPVRKVNAKFLFKQASLLTSAIQKSAGRVIVIICDENRLNQGFFKLFDTITQKLHGKPKKTFFYLTTAFIWSIVCARTGLLKKKTKN